MPSCGQPFDVNSGLSIGEMKILAGYGTPGGDNGIQDSAGIGSNYYDMHDGNQWAKTTDGTGKDKWVRQLTQADILAAGGTINFGMFLSDGLGSGAVAAVTPENALLVSMIPAQLAPINTPSRMRYMQGRPGSTGLNSGILSQNVNGTTTPQRFFINSEADCDIYITGICFLLSCSNPTHAKFGNQLALSKGYSVWMYDNGVISYIIKSATSNGDLLLQTLLFNVYGEGINSNIFSNWTGNTDAFTVVLNLGNIIPGGIRIGRGTADKMVFEVNDNLTNIADFIVQAFGYRHYN